MADVIAVVNRAGIVVSQNRAASLLLGCGPDGLVKLSIFEFIHAEDLPQFHSAFFNVIEGFRPQAIVAFRLRRQDGSYRLLEATVNPLGDVSVTCIVLSARDLTRDRLAQEETGRREVALAEAAKAKDQFLAMLSHELRTPLTPLLLGIADLQEDGRFPEALPTLAMMRRNLDLQSRLLDELMDYTRIGQHKVRLRPRTVDTHETVHLALEVCRGEIANAQIEVVLDLQAAESRVLTDSAKLQQVMWNLIKNAIKFSAPGSTITITSNNTTPGRIALEFIDHGIGIEPELLPFLFDAFHQGTQSTAHVNDGLGLGLFIAKGLAEAQGGTLSVTSKGRDCGATFILTMPTTDEPLPRSL
jgi:PAS domain S-box-containing protein